MGLRDKTGKEVRKKDVENNKNRRKRRICEGKRPSEKEKRGKMMQN